MAFPFKGVDFIAFDSLLTDDERLSRDTARQFIEDNLVPIIEELSLIHISERHAAAGRARFQAAA